MGECINYQPRSSTHDRGYYGTGEGNVIVTRDKIFWKCSEFNQIHPSNTNIKLKCLPPMVDIFDYRNRKG